jgi:hypothetical protein
MKQFKKDFGYMEFLRNSILEGVGALGEVQDEEFKQAFAKTDDAALLSTTAAAYNVVYGAYVWVWTNMEVPIWSALPKKAWESSGVRVKSASSSTLISGLSETEALPASTKPTYAYMKYPLRQMVTRLDYSRKLAVLSKGGDDTIPTPEQLRKDKGEEHVLGLNQALFANAETAAGAAGANYDGGKVFESLDRLISCNAEENDLGGSTYTGWYDPYDGTSYDRDSGTTHDSVVVHGDGTLCYQTGNPDFTVDATFSLEVMDTLYSNCRKNGLQQQNGLWVTGWDTYMRMKQLYADPKERFFDPVRVSFDVNGVRTEKGIEGGTVLSSYHGMPMIVDPNCTTDTISKVFLLDMSSVFIRVATPTVYIDFGFPAFSTLTSLAPRLGYGAIYLTEGEIAVTRFNTSGKLCALK